MKENRLERERVSLQKQAEVAEEQAADGKAMVAVNDHTIAAVEHGVTASERSGDLAQAQDLREHLALLKAERVSNMVQADEAKVAATELRERVVNITRQETKLEAERQDYRQQLTRAESEIDRMEQQADLYQRAAINQVVASALPGSALAKETEALVKQAEAIEVDRSAIRVLVPDLAPTTPGFDVDPDPRHAASQDDSQAVPADDALVAAVVIAGDVASDEPGLETIAMSGETPADEPTTDTAGDTPADLVAGSGFGDGADFGSTAAGEEFGDTAEHVDPVAASGFGEDTDTMDQGAGGSFDDTSQDALASAAAEFEPDVYSPPADTADPFVGSQDSGLGGDSEFGSDYASADVQTDFGSTAAYETDTFDA